MNNYSAPRPPFQPLPTNRSFKSLFIRGIMSFAILTIVDSLAMQSNLNTIAKPYTTKRANFMFFGRKTNKLINFELERRGINYRIKDGVFSGYTQCSKSMMALNLLCQDYNSRGC